MKKSTKGFIIGTAVATGLAAGIYYAKKKGYLDQASDYVKDHVKKIKKNSEGEEIFDEFDAADVAEDFTAPDDFGYSTEGNGTDDESAENRDYVSLDFSAEEAENKVEDKVEEIMDKVEDKVEDIKDAVSDKAEEIKKELED